MTKVVQFVEVDVPKCSLQYSEFPCRAQLDYIGGDAPHAIYTADAYGTRNAGLSGAADSKLATGSFWYRVSDNSITQTLFAGATTVGGTTTRFGIRFVAGIIRITGSTSGGTSILDIRTSTTMEVGEIYHVMFSFDLSNTGKRHVYLDGNSDINVVTYTNNTIDFTLADWSLMALPNGTESSDSSVFAQFWVSLGTYIDLSIEANRNLFRDNNGRPVWLGDNGEIPTGSSPIAYFNNTVDDDWASNLGTGGGFATNNGGGEENASFASGSRKCFNSLGTCQDLESFDEETRTYRFSEDVPDEFVSGGTDVTVFPFVKSVDFQPAIVSLEGQIGQRASLKVVFRDAPHNDSGDSFDKYPSSRDYNPYELGTFWGKFRARNPYMRGRQIRLYIGQAGQSLDSLEIRYFLIDSMDGPTPKGEFTISAQDILKLASGDRVVAPTPSAGFLLSDMGTGDQIGFTIAPSGALGSSNYGTDGYACIGGNEVVSYDTISGDDVNIFNRGSFNTEEVEHKAQDRLQVCLNFDGVDPAIVLDVLLEEFADIDGSYISTDDWQAESAAYLGIVISLFVTEPTPVDQLIEEVLEATGSAMWWDDVNQQIRWQVIRSIPTTADRFTEDNVLADTIETTEQPDKRVSQVIVYFGQINPTLKVDETRNYRSTEVVTDFESEALEGSSALKIIYARSIAEGGRAVANRIATRYLSRFVRAPRQFKFELFRFSVNAPSLGGGYLLGGPDVSRRSWPFQDDIGNWVDIPIQLTRVSSTPDRWLVEGEEMLANAQEDLIDTTTHNIIIDSNQNNVNLKEMHDSLYIPAVGGDTVNCYINSGVTIGSNDTGTPAFIVGDDWDGGATINIINSGRIQGCGGNGGNGSSIFTQPSNVHNTASDGSVGGAAFFTRQNINLTNNAQIWGGGGGGGASASNSYGVGGGGGSGTNAGSGGSGTATGWNFNHPVQGNDGNSESGGASISQNSGFAVSGAGGGPGASGSNGSGSGAFSVNANGAGGGAAVDGDSFVNYISGGDIQGSQIN